MNLTRFNIRVYGVLLNDSNQVLIADEIIKGQKITKFPGGGLEFGEGTVECIKREFKEETGININVRSHLYTTDIFQPSAFDDDSQVISIYYEVESVDWPSIIVSEKEFDVDMLNGKMESFRWTGISKLLQEEYFALPLDRIVGSILLDNYT